MKDDNTPTVTARRRNPTPHMRLRLETAGKLESLSKRIQTKREKAYHAKHSLSAATAAQRALTVPKVPKPKKNMLATPDKPPSKYRKRQVHKSWLPTHVWHAKRAHMPEPKMPLWRFAIPLSPTAKCHRPTHRAASSRGCVAWDTSYMSTILVRGVEPSLLGLLRAMCVEEACLRGKKGAKWRRGTRSWSGWIRERDGDESWMAETQIIWCAEKTKAPADAPQQGKKEKRQLLIGVHPSAFLQVWTEVLKNAKIQKPSPDVEDLRFEIGSIEITGPGSTEALVGILHPSLEADIDSSEALPEKIWPQLGAVTNPSALPAGAVLAFNIHDPRLFHPPRTVKTSTTSSAEHDLLTTLAAWPPDTTTTPSPLFSHDTRYKASRLPTQKAINRRKGDAPPGCYPTPLPTDVTIPILLLASRAPSRNMQGTWTLLLPWKCVLPVWYSLVHYPLSTGGTPRFGGLQEKRHLFFEQSEAWFPGDFPGSRAGWQWEIMEREKRKKAWEKRPKSKRVSWDAVSLGEGKKGEVGMGWACDWERLFQDPPPAEPESSTQDASVQAPVVAKEDATKEPPAAPPQPSQNEAPESTKPIPPTLPPKPPLTITHIPSTILPTLPFIPSHALTPIHLSLIHRGTPTTCARIYRLPSTNRPLRKKWLHLLASITNKTNTSKSTNSVGPLSCIPPDAPQHIKRQALARALIAGPPTAAEEEYPACPGEGDLIGFVTTGNFDLGKGRGAAVGNVAAARVFGGEGEMEDSKETGVKYRILKGEDKICVIRNAGQSVGRLARWEFI